MQSQDMILRLRILHLRFGQLLIISLDSMAPQMAICTHSKAFLATPIVQKLVNDIYSGDVVFSLPSTRSILADNYKPCPIQMYDVHKAPFLDHHRYADCSSRFCDTWFTFLTRLRVPRYGAIFEYLNFAILLITFILCVASKFDAKICITTFDITFAHRSK